MTEPPSASKLADAASVGEGAAASPKQSEGPPRGQLLHAPRLPIRYKGERIPAEFYFQDPSFFLYRNEEMRDWTWTERAPFVTERQQQGRFEFMRDAAGYIYTSGGGGDYHEYGCFSLNTFRMFLTWASIFPIEITKFWAFDSFQGLPEPDEGMVRQEWKAGAMCISQDQFWATIKQHGLFLDRIKTVPGYYNESLTSELQAKFVESERKIAMVTIDCDFYSSAVPVFKFIEPLLQEGSLIYLDDYFLGYRGSPKRGVAKAFWEFADYSRWRFHEFQTVGWWGKSFIAYS
jgi:hypothetical protein